MSTGVTIRRVAAGEAHQRRVDAGETLSGGGVARLGSEAEWWS